MTTRRFTRKVRNPVRRVFTRGTGSATAIGTTMVDLTPQVELAATADSQFGDLLVVGMAWGDLADEASIHQCVVWIGRTSTFPAVEDTGVRTRQFGANSQALPFVLRFRGIRVNPGEFIKLNTLVVEESVGSIIHQNLVSVKWSFRELRQG